MESDRGSLNILISIYSTYGTGRMIFMVSRCGGEKIEIVERENNLAREPGMVCLSPAKLSQPIRCPDWTKVIISVICNGLTAFCMSFITL